VAAGFPYKLYSLGDQAITIELGDEIDESINRKCLSLAECLGEQKINGVKDIVPAYCTVTVIYDAVEVAKAFHVSSAYLYMLERIHQVIDGCNWKESSAGRKITIPVCYDEAFALDIDHLASTKNISKDEVIHQHCSKPYRVYMLGFLPGFGYMGKVNEMIAMPRKDKPHLKVGAGSVGIAGYQTGIYPLASPGGWNIIGRTPLKLFDAGSLEPCLLKAGDEIIFQPIALQEFHQQNQNN
jgi:inhibitor of KinA